MILFAVFLAANEARSDIRIDEHRGTKMYSVNYEIMDDVLLSLQGPEKMAGRYLLPPVDGRISSLYGNRSDPIHRARSHHRGIDIAMARGAAVRAAGDGEVRTATFSGGCGLLVSIDHGGDLSTRYCHLSGVRVGRGERVLAGQRIGAVGATGRATGPHLHFEVISAGRQVDPASYLAY
jgi:murein DD-endopeptidase MepM/ murein hydrolase activator NlpD